MNSPFSQNTYDVIVVGSGLAGSMAAFSLAKQGMRVAVIEKAALPRYKTCGGGLVRRATRILFVDTKDAIERECSAAELHLLDSDLHFSVQRQQPIVSIDGSIYCRCGWCDERRSEESWLAGNSSLGSRIGM